MTRFYTTRTLLLATVFMLIPFKQADSAELARDKLLALAQSFVERIGQKLPPSESENDSGHNIPEGEILLLQPRLSDKLILDASIGAIRKNKELFLSFREFCDAMAFPIQVDTEQTTAQGWYILEKFGFKMDLKNGLVQSRGSQFTVTDAEWFPQDNEIYVSSNSIQKWMKIESEVTWNALLLDLTADKPFPIEDRLARRKRKLDNMNRNLEPVLPRVDNPYKIASVPNIEISTSTGIVKSPEGVETSQSGTITTAGDLLKHTARTYTTYDQQLGLTTFRMTAERESEQPDLLGPLKAKSYKFGDIEPVYMDLMGNSDQQWGVRATNAEDGQITGSTSRIFEGDIPPDWDIELYDGNQLIAFQTAGPEGRYRFSDVDLYAGDNDFRLVFYGPQGEVREEQVSIPVSLDDVGAGVDLYDASLSLRDRQTFNKVESESVDRGTPDLSVSYEHGVRDGLSINSGLRVYQAEKKQKVLAKTGLATRMGQTLLNFNVVTDEELEIAFQTVARRSFGKNDVRLSSFLATSAFDPENTNDNPVVLRHQMDIRGPLATLFGEPVSYTVNTNYQEFANNDSNLSTRFSQSTRYGRYTLGHALDLTRTTTGDITSNSVQSTYSMRRSIGLTRIRGALVYGYYPEPSWKTATVTLSRNLLPKLQGELEIEHKMDPQLTEATAQFNWQRDKYTLTPRLTYDTNQEMTATMNVRFGLTHDPYDKNFYMVPDLVNSRGAVEAFVFLDKDGNNKFDGTDEPVPEAKVVTVQVPRNKLTDDKGVAFLANLPEYEATDVVLEQSSLGDPYYVSGFEGMSVYPRPGAPTRIEFPVHISGELDGTVLKPSPRGMLPATGLRVILINERGEQAFSSLTAFDGYYVVSVVPPGQYLLMINPDDLKGTGYAQPWPQQIHIGYDGKILAGQDITLTPGQEVPLTFFKTPKPSVLAKQELPVHENIQLNFGSYKSGLLADIVHLRIKYALEDAGVKDLPIESVTDNSDKKRSTMLIAQISKNNLDEARNICSAISVRGLTCSITLPAALLIKDTRVALR